MSNIYLKVGDESMSEIRFGTTSKGGLTHLSYIFRKSGLLGTDFNNVDCYFARAFLIV